MGFQLQIWGVFIGSFAICAAALGRILLSRQDWHALRSMAEASPERRLRPRRSADGDSDAAPGADVIPINADAIQSPEDVEASIVRLAAGVDPGEGTEGTGTADSGGRRDGTAEDSDVEGDSSGGDDDEDDDHEDEEDDGDPGAAREATVHLMTFMEQSLTKFSESGMKFSAADKFGAGLFIAGACEAMSQAHSLTHPQFVKLLEKSLGAIGHTRKDAHKLADKYEEYLMEPQYVGIFQSGSRAMEQFGDETQADQSGAFAAAIKEWRNPKARQASGPVAVLFTDIVGSTKTTQEHGDAGAQELVRAHNRVVRNALKANAGKEVKHTGDGIMASFEVSSNSVDAAIAIIKGVEDYNTGSPKIPLHLRVGINSGDPIREDDDLFGSTVQMAARICDAAETDQALVSNIVRELCGGMAVDFRNAGQYGMKGIAEPVTLYEPVPKGG